MPGPHGSSEHSGEPLPSGAKAPPRRTLIEQPHRPRQRLRRSQRVTRTADFTAAYDQGRRWVGRYMVLWLRQGPDAALRLGVVAGRKVGGAVQRARAKRRLREVYRTHRSLLSGERDVILVARRQALEAPWPDMIREFLELAGRAGLMKERKATLG